MEKIDDSLEKKEEDPEKFKVSSKNWKGEFIARFGGELIKVWSPPIERSGPCPYHCNPCVKCRFN